MNFNSPDYLPFTEKRLAHLRKIINGRPVAILAAGPSINELEKRIGELREADICYFGMNTFFVQENHILQKINKHFSVVMAGINRGLPPVIDKIEEFLHRSDENMFTSSFFESQPELLGPDFSLENFIHRYDPKLLFIGISRSQGVPNITHPLHFMIGNTLAQLIYLATVGGASKIILFGADGATLKGTETYYRPQEYGSEPVTALIRDTNQFFNPVVPPTIHHIYRTHSIKPIEILNCSEQSLYTPFPTISYDHCLKLLAVQEKFDPAWDTRIPKASIISWTDLDGIRLAKTKESLAKQSYRNFEHVVITNNGVMAINEALEKSRGEYIFICPPGEQYDDPHWINTCLKVLENNPRLTLTWNFLSGPVHYLCVRKKFLQEIITRKNPRSLRELWPMLRGEFILWQISEAIKIIRQYLRNVAKSILPRSWVLSIHRQLKNWRAKN
ncbi:MAG: glycosyltransferase family A protein [bacterium]|nr:glycosyltransferase family A protein [bacterium]